MIVYRYLCEDEYKNIMSLNFDKIGGVYQNHGVSNTFRYKKNERYLHFFKNVDDMETIRELYLKDGKEYYYCSFDIPFGVLLTKMGKGYYYGSGYDIDYISKREFALPVSDFNPKWLRDAIFDEKKHEINLKNKSSKDNTLDESGRQL